MHFRVATPDSTITLRVCDQHKIFKDSIIGETSVSLRQLLRQNGSKLHSVQVTLPLTVPPGARPQQNSEFQIPLWL